MRIPKEDKYEPEVAYEATISMFTGNFIALTMLPLVYLLFLLPFGLVWDKPLINWQQASSPSTAGVILLVFLSGVVIHELLHAVGFLWKGRAPLSAIKFGFAWKALAPYAHCRVPITASAYRVSVALPGIILGLLPGLIGVATGAGWLALWGAVMTIAAGGDMAVLLAVRSIPDHVLVLDHPSEAGCLVLRDRQDQSNVT